MDKNDLILSLGKEKFGESFELPSHWEIDVINKIKSHFLEYKIENRALKIPQKGLFLCSDIEDNAVVLIHLLKVYIEKLYLEHEKELYYDRVLIGNKSSFSIISARQLSMESLEIKPLEMIKKYSAKNIFSIVDFGKDTVVNLSNYNKFDFVPEFLNKRYMEHSFLQANTVLYVFTNCTPRELKKRYPKEVFFHLKALTSEILLSVPG